jgi:tetratricopeptide (TPR) repeat protein/SAM-dependent methyltransferase
MNWNEQRATEKVGATAKAQLAPSATLSSSGIEEMFRAAFAQHQRGALDDAERGYRDILAQLPMHADSLHNLGLVSLQRGNAASAVDLIGQAIAINDQVADYHFSIASAFQGLKRMDNVEAHLERTIELRSEHALAHLNLGNVRRQQGKAADAIECFERALTIRPDLAAAHYNLANILFAQARLHEAISSYRRALAVEPNRAEIHRRLGTALAKEGNAGEAIHHLETALRLKPDLPHVNDELSAAYAAAGKFEAGALAAAQILELRETEAGKTNFVQCARFARFTTENAAVRNCMLRAVREGWARPRELTNACISLIKLNPAVRDCVMRGNAAWPGRLPHADMIGLFGRAAPLAKDELLLHLLEFDLITDIDLERLLINVRHAMLSVVDDAYDEIWLRFYCAVARQCFLNEYVFSLTIAETDKAQRLRTGLEQALAVQGPASALFPVVVGAYFPLNTLSKAEGLLERSWPQCVEVLITQQVNEPAQQRELEATIQALTEVDSVASHAVRRQYEENPYPRWSVPSTYGQSTKLLNHPLTHAADVLIAGCGTGLSTVEFARQMPSARILAIDLSLASLSYAKFMANRFALTNVEFGQVDIMRMSSLGREFDFIDASGVLHHLSDPWEGWRILLSLLRPGGTMQIGLYSEIARRAVVSARELIAERGYQPVPEDIRRCREEIMAADQGSLLKSLIQADDFFTTSECRDLLFHVQEHRLTLPDIKSFLAENDVQFSGFILAAPTVRSFATRFPEASAMTDLDCWNVFELGAPSTFSGMYQFWVQKPAART